MVLEECSMRKLAMRKLGSKPDCYSRRGDVFGGCPRSRVLVQLGGGASVNCVDVHVCFRQSAVFGLPIERIFEPST
jgi:hypothetical protein